MKIYNNRNQKVISQSGKFATTFLDRSLGLLRKSNPQTLLFQTRFGIHTLFLKDPIDVIILNDKLRVRKIVSNLKPNRFYFWNPIYKLVLELPEGSIKEYDIHIGDQLIFDPAIKN